VSSIDPKVCRSCGAPILWARTLKNRLMPIDAEPDPKGALVMQAGSGRAIVRQLTELDAPERLRYTSHFATCPNAKQHRKEPDRERD
jgi:hypothetical protein